MTDPLTEAVLKAGKELSEKHDFVLSDGGCISDLPTEKDTFTRVLVKNLRLSVEQEGWKRARINALRAELDELESDLENDDE